MHNLSIKIDSYDHAGECADMQCCVTVLYVVKKKHSYYVVYKFVYLALVDSQLHAWVVV